MIVRNVSPMSVCSAFEFDPPGAVPLAAPDSARSLRRLAISRASADPLGPFPERSVAAFADLGLDEVEIARYFGVERARVAWLLNHPETRRDGEPKRR